MEARFRLWLQYIRKHWVATVIIVFAVAIGLIITGYWFDWTGFKGYNKVTTTRIISGKDAGTVTRTEEFQPGKGVWDWLQLLGVLAIPVVVALGAAAITAQQRKTQEKAAKLQEYKDASQTFWENMSKLILDNKLLKSHEGDPVREIARAQTLVTLSRLSGSHGYKAALLQFLHEAKLIKNPDPIISLSPTLRRERSQSVSKVILAHLNEAFLNEADLHDAYLRQVDLSDADLSNADLSGADLQFTNLRKANLSGTDLTGADLTGAVGITNEGLEKQTKYLKGAIMPDGKMYHNSSGADLSGDYLGWIDLSGIDLSGANLSDANLWGAHLSKTNLSNAILFNADLSNAILEQANLNKAWVTREQLAKANSLKGATMPDGKTHA
jgi:uncharacterized protein YjbI with pentapeptide repeats